MGMDACMHFANLFIMHAWMDGNPETSSDLFFFCSFALLSDLGLNSPVAAALQNNADSRPSPIAPFSLDTVHM